MTRTAYVARWYFLPVLIVVIVVLIFGVDRLLHWSSCPRAGRVERSAELVPTALPVPAWADLQYVETGSITLAEAPEGDVFPICCLMAMQGRLYVSPYAYYYRSTNPILVRRYLDHVEVVKRPNNRVYFATDCYRCLPVTKLPE